MTTPIFRSLTISAATTFAVLFGIVTTSSIGFSTPIVTETANPQLGKPVRVALGSKAVFSADRLEITVLGIRDGRCRKDRLCTWPGEAKVTLNVQQAGKNFGDFDLRLGVGYSDYFDPSNIKKVGGYYVRVLEIDPYPGSIDSKSIDSKAIQTVTLQVQKTPFKLKDANLDPKLQPRPNDSTDFGKRFSLSNNQNYGVGNTRYIKADIRFEIRPVADRADLVEIFLTVEPNSAPDRNYFIKKIVKLVLDGINKDAFQLHNGLPL
ncbi:hypothetical protein [Chamaesiphon polymorphus]|uniref:Uncharacterized protein n=1 Tax=Chamaesiphon polymorphus CCALA 037 TaxID=2107692 RepID=A0A2T1G0T0_9CYAN|nr:hypothetical protein [Chamaesiphon polymorphus]PSB50855.1 hypothetical protein C7B77_22265 [Chamaesiphon polymorphus CCALA 037]